LMESMNDVAEKDWLIKEEQMLDLGPDVTQVGVDEGREDRN